MKLFLYGIVGINGLIALLELATGNWLGAFTNASIAGFAWSTRNF